MTMTQEEFMARIGIDTQWCWEWLLENGSLFFAEDGEWDEDRCYQVLVTRLGLEDSLEVSEVLAPLISRYAESYL